MRLFGDLYLVRDTGCPVDYPPRARREMTSGRQVVSDMLTYLARKDPETFERFSKLLEASIK